MIVSGNQSRMITGRDFVVLSDHWGGLPTSTMHLIRYIGPNNRVFWLNITTRMPRCEWSDAQKVARVVWSWFHEKPQQPMCGTQGLGKSTDPLVVRTPLMLPWFRRAVRYINAASISRSYSKLTAEFRITDPIIITTFPCVADFVRNVRSSLKLYYCVDDWTHYPGLNSMLWETMESELLRNVDGFIATSQDLRAKCPQSYRSLYLPHGVDFAHFHGATVQRQTVPEMECIPKPIVGFFGVIAEWINLDVVASLSRAFPDVSFVLIGPAAVSLASFANCANVFHLGPRAYEHLPAYARYFDVGLIPFALNKLTKAVNPLKLFEYYALGLPVLATRLPELERADGPLWLAVTEDEFRRELQHALDYARSSSGEHAVQVAQGNSWEQRAQDLSDYIAGLL